MIGVAGKRARRDVGQQLVAVSSTSLATPAKAATV